MLNQNPPRPWTDDDLTLLRDLVGRGLRIAAIALQMNRTYHGVRWKARRIGIVFPHFGLPGDRAARLQWIAARIVRAAVMASPQGQLLLAIRTERFARTHWPQRRFHVNHPWVRWPPERRFRDFIWVTFEDDESPGAVGLRLVTRSEEEYVYEAAEWHSTSDIRCELFRYVFVKGWSRIGSLAPAIELVRGPRRA